jgi:hypothetical protein
VAICLTASAFYLRHFLEIRDCGVAKYSAT